MGAAQSVVVVVAVLELTPKIPHRRLGLPQGHNATPATDPCLGL